MGVSVTTRFTVSYGDTAKITRTGIYLRPENWDELWARV